VRQQLSDTRAFERRRKQMHLGCRRVQPRGRREVSNLLIFHNRASACVLQSPIVGQATEYSTAGSILRARLSAKALHFQNVSVVGWLEGEEVMNLKSSALGYLPKAKQQSGP
jgi:hypothetical protein